MFALQFKSIQATNLVVLSLFLDHVDIGKEALADFADNFELVTRATIVQRQGRQRIADAAADAGLVGQVGQG